MITRRTMIRLLAGATPTLSVLPALWGAQSTDRKRLGVGMHSYGIHWGASRSNHPQTRFKDALEFLEYCHQLGAGGVQVAIGSQEPDYAAKIRAKVETHQMYLEAQT